MIIVGDQETDELARRAGAECARAVCSLDILYADGQLTEATGTLVKVHPKAGTGWILTCAHTLRAGGAGPVAIAISFDPNPIRNLDRVLATGSVCHPDFEPKERSGPDLALVEFPLPKDFDVWPMMLPDREQFGRYEHRTHFMCAGYGSFALNRIAGEARPAQEDKAPARARGKGEPAREWATGLDALKVRRLCHQIQAFKTEGQALFRRRSYESRVHVKSMAELLRAGQCQPYSFIPSRDDLYRTGPLWTFWEGVTTAGDSGGPLFMFDPEDGGFRILGVVASFAGLRGDPGGLPCLLHNATAVGPEAMDWIEQALEGKLHALSTESKYKGWVAKGYNRTFKLGLSGKDVDALAR